MRKKGIVFPYTLKHGETQPEQDKKLTEEKKQKQLEKERQR